MTASTLPTTSYGAHFMEKIQMDRDVNDTKEECRLCKSYFSHPFSADDYTHDYWFMGDDEWNTKNI